MESEFEHIIRWLRELRAKGTYGQTTLVWQGAKIVRIKHEDSYLPVELPVRSAVK